MHFALQPPLPATVYSQFVSLDDLSGVRYDPTKPGELNEDTLWHGFEHIGSELSLSPSHVEKYLRAAKEILDQAFPDEEPRQTKAHRDALDVEVGTDGAFLLSQQVGLIGLEAVAGEAVR